MEMRSSFIDTQARDDDSPFDDGISGDECNSDDDDEDEEDDEEELMNDSFIASDDDEEDEEESDEEDMSVDGDARRRRGRVHPGARESDNEDEHGDTVEEEEEEEYDGEDTEVDEEDADETTEEEAMGIRMLTSTLPLAEALKSALYVAIVNMARETEEEPGALPDNFKMHEQRTQTLINGTRDLLTACERGCRGVFPTNNGVHVSISKAEDSWRKSNVCAHTGIRTTRLRTIQVRRKLLG